MLADGVADGEQSRENGKNMEYIIKEEFIPELFLICISDTSIYRTFFTFIVDSSRDVNFSI